MKPASLLCLLQFHFTSLIWWAESELTPTVAAHSTTYCNCEGKLLQGRVQEMGLGCRDGKEDGSVWKMSCSLADAHCLSTGGQWRNLLDLPPGITAFPQHRHCFSEGRSTGKMKPELNEAPAALLRLHATVMRAIQMFHELPDKVRKAV